MANTLERKNFWRRWSPLFFASAMTILFISAWRAPLSTSYLVRACLIGLAFGVLTMAYWRWEPPRPSRLVWSALSLVLVAGGFYWSKDQTFGVSEGGEWSWRLAGQFMAMVFATFFAPLIATKLTSRSVNEE